MIGWEAHRVFVFDVFFVFNNAMKAGRMTTTLRMSEELEKRYVRLAEDTGRSRTFYLRKALEDSIDRLEYEYGILQKVEDYRAGRLETVTLEELEMNLGLADQD